MKARGCESGREELSLLNSLPQNSLHPDCTGRRGRIKKNKKNQLTVRKPEMLMTAQSCSTADCSRPPFLTESALTSELYLSQG